MREKMVSELNLSKTEYSYLKTVMDFHGSLLKISRNTENLKKMQLSNIS